MILLDNTKTNNLASPLKRDVVDSNLIVKLYSMLSNSGYLCLKIIKPLSDQERRRITRIEQEEDLSDSLSRHFSYTRTVPLTFGNSQSVSRYVFAKNSPERVWLSYRDDFRPIVMQAQNRTQIYNYRHTILAYLVDQNYRLEVLEQIEPLVSEFAILIAATFNFPSPLQLRSYDSEPEAPGNWALYQDTFLNILKTSNDPNQAKKYRYKIMAYLADQNYSTRRLEQIEHMVRDFVDQYAADIKSHGRLQKSTDI